MTPPDVVWCCIAIALVQRRGVGKSNAVNVATLYGVLTELALSYAHMARQRPKVRFSCVVMRSDGDGN